MLWTSTHLSDALSESASVLANKVKNKHRLSTQKEEDGLPYIRIRHKHTLITYIVIPRLTNYRREMSVFNLTVEQHGVKILSGYLRPVFVNKQI